MTGFLQAFDFRSSRYERPNQAWTCGHAAKGRPCRIGPDRRGRCRADFECQPRCEDGRWTCTRTPDAGGKCSQGPLPDGTCCRPILRCAPVRSLRARRRQFVLWVVAITIGLLALGFGGPAMMAMVSPGPVTPQHGEIGDCGGCHDVFEGGPTRWIHAAFAPLNAKADSDKCLACHEMGADSLKPHGLPPATLARLTEEAAGEGTGTAVPVSLSVAGALFDAPTRAAGDLACATCHREHQGQAFELTAMSDARCQSCHTVKFAAFSRGHPEIDRYPYERRTRIHFDHVSHITRHFEKAGLEKAPETCTACHGPAQDGRMMQVGGFSETCAACHTDQIAGVAQVGPKGAAFLAAPGFDLIELRDRGAAIGEWPEESEQGVTPFMKLLLAEDPGFAADIARLEALDPLDLTEAEDEDIAAIERIAWGVKELIFDLIAAGTADAQARLSTTLGMDMMGEAALLSRLLGSMPLDVIRATQAAWFPNLFDEVARHRRGDAVPIPGDEDAVALAEPAPSPSVDDAAGDDILGQGDDILGDDGDILGDDGDILGEEDDILGEGDDILGEDDSLAEADGGAEAQTDGADAAAAAMPEIDPEAWARMGGWYRQDFALYFRPRGHADPFLRTWLDVSGKIQATESEPFAAAVFAGLTDKDAPGKCVKCHSVDRASDGTLAMQWQPAKPRPDTKSATIFSHTTHFSLLHEEGCRTCHKLDRQADYAASYKDQDPQTFASNFSPLRVETCARCHVEQTAGDSCLLCHQYHVGSFETKAVPTEMAKDMK